VQTQVSAHHSQQWEAYVYSVRIIRYPKKCCRWHYRIDKYLANNCCKYSVCTVHGSTNARANMKFWVQCVQGAWLNRDKSKYEVMTNQVTTKSNRLQVTQKWISLFVTQQNLCLCRETQTESPTGARENLRDLGMLEPTSFCSQGQWLPHQEHQGHCNCNQSQLWVAYLHDLTETEVH